VDEEESGYMDAISAMKITTILIPAQVPRYTQIAPAGPPLVRERTPVLWIE
jgi:hypothetical protein